jgi:autotransporter passenger strand-loop-strand repeat protein
MTTIYVSADVTSTGLVISNGETLDVLSGGTAVSITVTSGGYEYVSGGKTVGTVVSNGGEEVVFSGGVTSSTAVIAGGHELVLSGGTAFSTTVSNGGSASDIPGGVLVGTIVSNGGTEDVNGTASSTIVSSGGTQDVLAGGTAAGIVLSAGGTALLEESSVASGGIIFAGSGADLEIRGNSLDDPTILASATVSGFVQNTTIDLAGVQYSGGTATLLSDDDLRVIESGMTLDIKVSDPNYTSATTFTLASDGSGGSKITTDAACYRAGTRIRTDHGEVPVEALGIGDRVLSAFGGTVPVTWLGQRRVACRRHPKPQDVWPVRVAAGAFGADLPRRDLFLSPDHAVFVGGVLIPIRYLVNDATIVQEPMDEVTYWHVELPAHDVLFAEGLPAESYLDTGNRDAFANGGGSTMLHPDFALRVWEAEACAKLVREGAELVAIRNVLFDCAASLGHLRTRDAGLHVVANGRVVRPEVAGRVHRFRLGRMACAVRLVSRGAVPAAVRADSDDHRRLGVAVSRLWLDGREIPLAAGSLGTGWHAYEPDGSGGGWRWTDGDAALDVAGAGVLEVQVAMTERYWLAHGTAATRVA